MKTWILIWRLNPPHIWHMRIINESFKKNDKTILLLGSSNIKDDNNPFTFDEREKYINILYENKSLIIDQIADFPSDEDWTIEINKILEQYINKDDELTFYGWDFENDYAIKVLKDYSNLLSFNNINFVELSRKDITIIHNNQTIEISSTKVRETIQNKDKGLLEKLVDERIMKELL